MAVKTVQATINGQTYTLTLNAATGNYEATLTAPAVTSYNQSGGYYGVTIRATDDAGNTTTANASTSGVGESLRLVVKEKVKPVIRITSPSEDAFITTNTPTINFTVTDEANGSGVDDSTIKVYLDDSEVTETITITGDTAYTRTCTFVPTKALGDGEHKVTISASDNDGNAASDASIGFVVDTVAPTLTVTNPDNNAAYNTASLTVSGTTNDATSSPVTVKIKLNGADQGTVTVSSTGAWSKAITLGVGSNTIMVTATDSAGKTTSITRTVTLDATAPQITSVTLTPNPVDCGATFIISVNVTDE